MNEPAIRCGGDHIPSSLLTFKGSSREYLVCEACEQLSHYSNGIVKKIQVSKEMVPSV